MLQELGKVLRQSAVLTGAGRRQVTQEGGAGLEVPAEGRGGEVEKTHLRSGSLFSFPCAALSATRRASWGFSDLFNAETDRVCIKQYL